MLPALVFPTSRPLVAAHRGALGAAPENTIAAFAQAVIVGADVIELDLHPTRDGRLVVLHDVTTTRTTGCVARVHDLMVAQVTALETGCRDGGRRTGQRVPALEEVLSWARDRVYLNLDVRNYPALHAYATADTADALVAAIDRAGVADQVVVQCLDHQLAREVHARCPAVAVGITQHGRPVCIAAIAQAAGAVLVSGDAAFATAPLVGELHAAGIGLMTSVELRLPGLADDVATVEETTARLLTAGVDIVVTDQLAATVDLVARRSHGARPDPPHAREVRDVDDH